MVTFKAQQFDWHLSQIAQTTTIQFAFCDEIEPQVYQNLIPFCKCRDFLNDFYLKPYMNINYTIYGFKYSLDTKQQNQDHTLLALFFANQKEYNNFIKNIHTYLPSIEKANNLIPFELYKTNLKNYLVIKADKYWQEHPLTMSFFSFLLRCCCYNVDINYDLFEQINNYQEYSIEKNYLTVLNLNFLKCFYLNLKQIIPSDFELLLLNTKTDLYVFHDFSGFYSFVRNDTSFYLPDYKELRKTYAKLKENLCQVDAVPVTQS